MNGQACAVDVRAIRTPGLGDVTYRAVCDGLGFWSILSGTQTGSSARLTRRACRSAGFWRPTCTTTTSRERCRRRGGRAPGWCCRPARARRSTTSRRFTGEDLHAGRLVIRPLHTPGHTPEHCSYLLLVEDKPVAVFTGGSLLSVRLRGGRTCWARSGRGSSPGCSTARCAGWPRCLARWRSTDAWPGVVLRRLRRRWACALDSRGGVAIQPALAYADAEAFADGQLAGLQPYPGYTSAWRRSTCGVLRAHRPAGPGAGRGRRWPGRGPASS